MRYSAINTRRWPNVVSMLGNRLRRWPNINTTMDPGLVRCREHLVLRGLWSLHCWRWPLKPNYPTSDALNNTALASPANARLNAGSTPRMLAQHLPSVVSAGLVGWEPWPFLYIIVRHYIGITRLCVWGGGGGGEGRGGEEKYAFHRYYPSF